MAERSAKTSFDDAGALPRVDDRRLYDLSMGIFGAQAFLVAFDLGVFSFLESSPATLDAIAARFDIDERSADAVMTVCRSLDLVDLDGGFFRLTDLSRTYLLPSQPLYFGDFLKGAVTLQPRLTSFESVKKAVVEGRTQAYGGAEMFHEHAQAPERAREFTLMMHGHAIASALAWPNRIDLSDVARMVDVGGGSGAHAIGAALAWPKLTATVLEIEAVIPVAEETVARYGVAERVTAALCDFWADPLPEADLHFYGDIFHDWPDEKCLLLMTKSFAALRPGGRIMIHEVLYEDDNAGPFVAASMSIAMLMWTEGRQRTKAAYAKLLESAGFVEVTRHDAFGYWSIVSASKPAE